jgi:hypothetical protein
VALLLSVAAAATTFAPASGCVILPSSSCGVLICPFVRCLCAGIVVQGETEAELPEHVLACAALKYIDVEKHSPLESFPF